jgi:hypothetical protein
MGRAIRRRNIGVSIARHNLDPQVLNYILLPGLNKCCTLPVLVAVKNKASHLAGGGEVS